MSAVTTASPSQREPEFLGHTVVVVGGSSGIGLETAREQALRAPVRSTPAGIPNALNNVVSELEC